MKNNNHNGYNISKKDNFAVVVYDNLLAPNPSSKLADIYLEKGWGFSLFVRFHGRSILFDCGWSSKILFSNLQMLGISIIGFDDIIISHQHWDHMGALSEVVDMNPDSTIYIPKGFSRHLAQEIADRVKKVVIIDGEKGPIEVNKDLFISGGIKGGGDINEQAALLKGSRCSLMVVGCMHPGLKPLYDIISKKIQPNTVIGGFHSFSDITYLLSTDIEHTFIGHCTKYPEVFENLDGIEFKKIYTGFYLEL